MTTLVIKDLQESQELDRKAMQTIVGGRRTRLNAGMSGRSVLLKRKPNRLFR